MNNTLKVVKVRSLRAPVCKSYKLPNKPSLTKTLPLFSSKNLVKLMPRKEDPLQGGKFSPK